jgi:hypothetical protein
MKIIDTINFIRDLFLKYYRYYFKKNFFKFIFLLLILKNKIFLTAKIFLI